VRGSLHGKVVVVTGSTRGIGRVIAQACAARGATVVLNGRGAGVAEALAELHDAGAIATCVSGDVSRPEDVRRLFDHVLTEHGRIDVWFNNAGLSGGFRPLSEFSEDEIVSIVDTNITGVMLCCRLVIPYMRENGGLIVNMCGRGSRGEVAKFGAVYAATKAAVASLTRSVAEENSDAGSMAIIGMIPGMVDTDFYSDMNVSPSLADKVVNVEIALDAFGASLDEVGEFGAMLAARGPAHRTGEIHSIIGRSRAMKGVAKLMRARMTGKMKPL